MLQFVSRLREVFVVKMDSSLSNIEVTHVVITEEYLPSKSGAYSS